MNAPVLPLKGVRIVDLTWVIAGPMCTKYLAAFGAEVIKVEFRGGKVDYMRLLGPFRPGNASLNTSGQFNNFNTDKLGVTVNLGHPSGRALLRRLVAVSDVVIDNYTPQTMEGWGLTYDTLKSIRQDIIALTMPGMGTTGPKRHFKIMGAHLQTAAGLDELMGHPGKSPTGTGMSYPDAASNPFHAALALLSALHHRNRTGQGQHIELAQFESTICFLGPELMDYFANGRSQTRSGNRSPYMAPHNAYRCQGQDRWVTIAVTCDQEWQALRTAMGSPAWTGEQRFATLPGRLQHVDELDALIEAWTQERTAEEVMHRLQAAGVPAGVVQNSRDLLEQDPQMKHRGFYVKLDHPEAGPIHHDGIPFKLSETPGRLRRPAPLLGQHTDYVVQQLLGLSEEEANNLLVEGVL